MVRKPALMATLTLMLALQAGSAALAQPDAEDRTIERAGNIASQPAKDVGLAKDEIPPVLLAAVEDSYKRPPGGCQALVKELGELNAVLGPDFDQSVKGDDKMTQLAEAGGMMIVNTLVPFRGLVREVSGAAAAERRMRAAVNAGIARRGYLRGFAQQRGCKLPVSPAAK